MNLTGDSRGVTVRGVPATTRAPASDRRSLTHRWPAKLLAAFAVALAFHVLALTLFAWSWQRSRPFTSTSPSNPGREESPALVDLTSVDELAPRAVDLAPPPAPLPPPSLAGSAPQDTTASGELTTRQRGDLPGHRAPRTDRGAEAGKDHAPAFRPDRSTLHERLSDGADLDQLPSTRNGARPASPQALRREPRTGEGDSPTTVRPTGFVPEATAAAPVMPEAGEGPARERAGGADREARPGEPGEPPPESTSAAAAGQGPLAADRGPRAFDVAEVGPAREVESRRAASSELRPGRLDLTLASAPGPGLAGRGPGAAAGQSARASQGAALNAQGGQESGGAADGDAARERQYLRYHQEIARRVADALVFPRKLALRLEQGETIVRFSVLPSGRLGGAVELQKSSGFEEFDQAARRAVEKGAPFPPLPPALRARALAVSLRVPFENPMVR